MIHAMYELEESYAVYYMRSQGVEHAELLQEMTILYEELSAEQQNDHKNKIGKNDAELNDYPYLVLP